MRFEDQLSSEQKQKLKALSKPNKPPSKKAKKNKRKTERVNWIDIMGMNRDRYGRHNGAMRRK